MRSSAMSLLLGLSLVACSSSKDKGTVRSDAGEATDAHIVEGDAATGVTDGGADDGGADAGSLYATEAPTRCENYLDGLSLGSTDAYAWCASGGYFKWTSTTAANNGQTTNIFYTCQDDSTKPAILFIHGWPTSSYDFSKVAAILDADYYVCALDTAGYGFSDKILENYTYSIFDDAKLVDAFVRYVAKLKSFVLVTHDKGDSVGLELLEEYESAVNAGTPPPYQITKHAFFDGNIDLPHAVLSSLQLMLLDPTTGSSYADSLTPQMVAAEVGLSSFSPPLTTDEQKITSAILGYQDGTSNPQNGIQVLDNTVQYLNERAAHEDEWLAALQSSTFPTLMMWGEKDSVAPPPVADFAYHHDVSIKTPLAYYWRFPCANHYIEYDHSTDSAGVLAAFITGTTYTPTAQPGCTEYQRETNVVESTTYSDYSSIVSGYWSADNTLPATGICPGIDTAGYDALTLVFSKAFAPGTTFPGASSTFSVANSAGTAGTVVCATLAPGISAGEDRTVLLVGQFADVSSSTTIGQISVTGTLSFADGTSAKGLGLASAPPLNHGESLMYAAVLPTVPSDCTVGTVNGIKVAFDANVSGSATTSDFSLKLANASGQLSTLAPIGYSASEESDGDNYVDLCFPAYASGYKPIAISVVAGVYADLGGVKNLATATTVFSQ